MPSRSLIGAITNYYQRSLQYSIVQKLFLWSSLRHTSSFQRSLWKCAPPLISLIGTIKLSFWRCTKLLPAVFPIIDRTETILGEISPIYASLPEVSLEIPSPRELSLGFGTIKASIWRCTKLQPEVSPVFYRTETTLGEISPTYASLPEVSLEMRPPREFSLGFGTIKAFVWCCSEPLSQVSPVFDRTEATLMETLLHTPAFQRSLWKCVPP